MKLLTKTLVSTATLLIATLSFGQPKVLPKREPRAKAKTRPTVRLKSAPSARRTSRTAPTRPAARLKPRRRRPRPATPPVVAAGPAGVNRPGATPAAAPAAANAATGDKALTIPGEKEFNECVNLLPGAFREAVPQIRRSKVVGNTLKPVPRHY